MHKLHAHLLYEPTPADLATLQGELSPHVLLTTGPEPGAPSLVHVLVAGRPSAELLDACTGLQALIIPFAGVPDQTRLLLLDRPHLQVFNLHHNHVPTAETALALLLSAAKLVVPLDASLRAHDWRPRYQPSQALLLHGRTAVVLGLGHIGLQLAGYLQALGIKVIGVRRRPQKLPGAGLIIEVRGIEALTEVLPMAQILAITLPLTEETSGLIGEKELSLLPQGAVLVNVARGPVVKEKALYDALRKGHLHSAGLDTWYRYPEGERSRASTPPSRYPFRILDNVVLSPHRGGAVAETETLRIQHLARLLNQYQEGERGMGEVDVKAGY